MQPSRSPRPPLRMPQDAHPSRNPHGLQSIICNTRLSGAAQRRIGTQIRVPLEASIGLDPSGTDAPGGRQLPRGGQESQSVRRKEASVPKG